MRLLFLVSMLASSSFASTVVIDEPTSTSLKQDGIILWTYSHDPAEGKPYFHPLASTDGTQFTDLRPADHAWHRGLWFSWKLINGVNYWEEQGATGIPREGYTNLLSTKKNISKSNDIQIDQKLNYAPAKDAAPVMTEKRVIAVSAPDAQGVYIVDWASTFMALDKDVLLDRTPLLHEPNGKPHGGYAGLSVRMNKQVGASGTFVNSNGLEGMNSRGKAAAWEQFSVPEGGTLVFMDHPDNLNYPAKWFVSVKMPYFSPAVIFDGAHTIKAGKTLSLKYRVVMSPTVLSKDAAEKLWKDWK